MCVSECFSCGFVCVPCVPNDEEGQEVSDSLKLGLQTVCCHAGALGERRARKYGATNVCSAMKLLCDLR